MPSHQFLNPAPVFYDLLALSPLEGGQLFFYDIGTSNPKNTWSDAALTILNPNPIILDSAGRLPNAVFMDGDYRVKCLASDDTLVFDMPFIAGGDASNTFPDPTGKDGWFYSWDGTNIVLQDIQNQLLPDATDSTSQYPVTNGAGGYTLTDVPAAPEIPEPDIVIDTVAKSVRIGTSDKTTKFLTQYGEGSAPSTNAKGTSLDIDFGTEFLSVWFVSIMPNITQATPSGALVDWSVTNLTNTGCTVIFNVSDDDNNAAWMIDRAIGFKYEAKGTVLVIDEDD